MKIAVTVTSPVCRPHDDVYNKVYNKVMRMIPDTDTVSVTRPA